MCDQQELSQQLEQQAKIGDDKEYVSFFSPDKYFIPVPDDKRIVVRPFLDKTSQIVEVFDVFGTMFSPVKKDMKKNIKTLYEVLEKDPEKFATIDDMLDYEIKEKKQTACIAGVWLGRALNFMYCIFARMVEDHEKEGTPEESLKDAIEDAYEKSLKKHHNTISKMAFQAVKNFVPYRTNLYRGLLTKLSADEKKSKTNEEVHNMIYKEMKPYLEFVLLNIEAWQHAFAERKLQDLR